MNVLETAWAGLTQGIGALATALGDLDDIVILRTNTDLTRLEEFTDLRAATDGGRYAMLGGTLTLTRNASGEEFCLAVGVSDAPAVAGSEGLCSWQFGFWCDADVETRTFVSAIYALRAEAGILLVLEELRPVVDASLQQFISGCVVSNRAFVSYVREDSATIDRLSQDLVMRGVATWTDRKDLAPGVRWKSEIKKAIESGSAFIACFSRHYESRARTYMNEELTIAVEELRLRPRDRAWFFPVCLDGALVPAISIGAGETLQDLQSVSLAADWEREVGRLARAIRALSD
jgi:hypothetical protein